MCHYGDASFERLVIVTVFIRFSFQHGVYNYVLSVPQVCLACHTLCLTTKPRSNLFLLVTWRCTTLTNKEEPP